MRKYRGVVNWSEELLRRFVEEKLRGLEAKEAFGEVLRGLERATWSAPRGFSAASVRGAVTVVDASALSAFLLREEGWGIWPATSRTP